MDNTTTILTIEDESIVRMSLTAHLDDMGYQYVEAEDGRQGVEMFERCKPDLVLCDLRLPEMDGLDVLSAIAEIDPDVPVIIVSGANQLSDAIEAIKRGAWDYITKPIADFRVLNTAIERALSRATLIRENRQYQKNLESLNHELSLALEQLQEDEEAARELQRGLLPEDKKQFGDYLFELKLIPSMVLSGDFVDYFPIGGHEVGFYMADISGHGAASAFVTVMLKTLIEKHRQAFETGQNDSVRHPSVMLDHLNRDILHSPIDKYLTIFYAVLSLDEGKLRYCSGGQFPYPMLERGEKVKALMNHDRPVGLFEDSTFTEHEVDLSGTSKLMLISDGILELFPQDSARRRTEWLLEEISTSGLSIGSLVDRFEIEGRDELPDDVAFLSISMGGSSYG